MGWIYASNGRKWKSLGATETVTVLLSSEVVWQWVPYRGTHNSEGPTAECGEPVSWYDELQTLPADDVGDGRAAVDKVFRSRALQTPVHSIWNIK